jgi:hypothetical protein
MTIVGSIIQRSTAAGQGKRTNEKTPSDDLTGPFENVEGRAGESIQNG